ncbi:glycerophosphodiester phosphodiesterase [Flavobacterium sp. LaA7.5]|nr:glycerophosphodiester phosphodiesterase [Flavobacterium salilacus subsp. altitudinum]
MSEMLKIGHRGAKGHIAENTLESFTKALDLGAEAVELDVHVCATGELVVFHDFTVDRTTNGSGEVHQLSLAELKALQVEDQYTIATLEEVLAFLQGRCFINIEMKGRHTAKPLAKLLEKYTEDKRFAYNDIIVSSFQYEELKQMSQLNPDVPLGILTQASVAQAWEWAVEFSAKAIHPHYSLLTETNVERVREAGFKIYTWTVNEPEDIARVKSYGVDGIISDYPERL